MLMIFWVLCFEVHGKMRLGFGLVLLVVGLVEVRQGHARARATLGGLESRSFLAERDDGQEGAEAYS